jgi:hypothetical protein
MKMAGLRTEKSKTYEQLAIFMLRGALEAHDTCCKIAFTLIETAPRRRWN